MVAPRLPAIWLSATFTMEVSINSMMAAEMVVKTIIAKNLQGNWKFCKSKTFDQIKLDIGSIKNIEISVNNPRISKSLLVPISFLDLYKTKGEKMRASQCNGPN